MINTKKITIKEFRKWLNRIYSQTPKHKHYRYHQLKREYGDYLYFQDKEKFDYYFEIFKKLNNPTRIKFESKI